MATVDRADAVFGALADANRRHLLALLSERGEASATELARALPVTRQGVQKHLAVLPKALEVDLPPGVACYSTVLFQRLGETERFEEMIEYLVLNVIPHLRNKDLVNFEHDAKWLFLECYRLCLTQIDRRPRLTQPPPFTNGFRRSRRTRSGENGS